MQQDDWSAALDGLRQQGVHVAQPTRFHTLAAMARRASAYSGETRRRIDARIAVLLEAFDVPAHGDMARAAVLAAPAAVADSLTALTRQLAAQAAARGEAPLPAAPGAGLATRPEPQSLDHFRRTWARLSAQRRLVQSLETMPENPGPLNSQRLVHRALTLMREASPAYLHHFMARVDALAALEQIQTAPSATTPAARPEGTRKPARRRKAG